MELFIAFGILLFITFLVCRDARLRGMNAHGWTISVFLCLLIALPVYLIFRSPKILVAVDPVVIEPISEADQSEEIVT